MSATVHYAAAVRDELWVGGVLVERRLSFGEAHAREEWIVARDRSDAALVEQCNVLLSEMRPHVHPRFRTRLIAEATTDGSSSIIVVSEGDRSIVSTPLHVDRDVALLENAASRGTREGVVAEADLPLLWRNGSAAVLLHELIGHPMEHQWPAPELPPWLRVDVPMNLRRASFRDVPLHRMTAVMVSQRNAPFEEAGDRIEIELVEGGSWDPITDVVSIRVSHAERVAGDSRDTTAPFTIVAERERLLRSLCGAYGAPERYPGVICSREGQELFVASYAPVLLTVLP